MTDDQKALVVELHQLADRLQRLETSSDVVDQILDGALLSLEQAADVGECSDEKIRKSCELTAGTKRPLGVKFAGRWFVGKERLLDDLEQGKIDRRRGRAARDGGQRHATGRNHQPLWRPAEAPRAPTEVPDAASAGMPL